MRFPIKTKVVGTSMTNELPGMDGKHPRQSMIDYIRQNNTHTLILVREYDNKFDSNAISVVVDTGVERRKIGYISNNSYTCNYCKTVREKVKGGLKECPACGSEDLVRTGLASQVAPLLDAGKKLRCRVLSVTGGEEGKPTLGCNIEITDEYTPFAASGAKV